MKKKYMTPEQYVVVLQYRTQLLADSLTEVTIQGFDDDDKFVIVDDTTPVDEGFWGR